MNVEELLFIFRVSNTKYKWNKYEKETYVNANIQLTFFYQYLGLFG